MIPRVIFLTIIIVTSIFVLYLLNNQETSTQIIVQREGLKELIDEGLTGENVKIAVIDTGINQELLDYFSSNNYSYYNSTNDSNEIIDEHSHGSWITCIMKCISSDDNSKGLIPDSSFIFIKVQDANGRIEAEYLSSAIRYAREKEVDIINLSVGTLINYNSIESEIEKAISEGIIILAAYGSDEEMYPARYENVYSVATFSTENNADIVVDASVFELDQLINTIHNYSENPTSSFSCAVVTSYVALLIEKSKIEGTEFDISNLERM